jgi:hypothetical protein
MRLKEKRSREQKNSLASMGQKQTFAVSPAHVCFGAISGHAPAIAMSVRISSARSGVDGVANNSTSPAA